MKMSVCTNLGVRRGPSPSPYRKPQAGPFLNPAWPVVCLELYGNGSRWKIRIELEFHTSRHDREPLRTHGTTGRSASSVWQLVDPRFISGLSFVRVDSVAARMSFYLCRARTGPSHLGRRRREDPEQPRARWGYQEVDFTPLRFHRQRWRRLHPQTRQSTKTQHSSRSPPACAPKSTAPSTKPSPSLPQLQ